MMFGRYRRLVPGDQRDLIRRHHLPKPDWYVGSAERGAGLSEREERRLLRDPTVQAEIEAIRAKIRARRRA